MKEQILALYKSLPRQTRAGICDLVARLVFAAEHDPEIIPDLMERPSEQACIEQNADVLAAAKQAITELLPK